MGFPPMASAVVERFQPDGISAAVLASPTSRTVCHERQAWQLGPRGLCRMWTTPRLRGIGLAGL